MAIVEGQKIEMKWNGKIKKHYVDLGYKYTKLGNVFLVKPEHLTRGSAVKVDVQCDICGKVHPKIFNQIYRDNLSKNDDIFACAECGSKKLSIRYRDNKSGFKLHKHCSTEKYRGIIYEINDDLVYKLSEDRKILINEMQRYCEENGKFPDEKKLSNKNGYISRSIFKQYFNYNSFTELFKYIYRVEEKKPKTRVCNKCGIEKELNEENFPKGKNSKFGLKTTCKCCEKRKSRERIKREYKKKGIVFEDYSDISPEKWWEYQYKGKIKKLPKFCYEEENIIRIVRYIVFNVMNIKTKSSLKKRGFLSDEELKKYNIFYFYRERYTKYEFINKCFPEFNIKPYDFSRISLKEEHILEFIDSLINHSDLSINDILNKNINLKKNKDINSLINNHFDFSYTKMLIWYFDKRKIKHPIFNRYINVFDFRYKPNNFWDKEKNRRNAIIQYCTDRGIDEVLDSTNKLKDWVFNNFKQPQIVHILDYNRYFDSLYDCLIFAYPQIKDSKILFKWEWHQWNSYNKAFMDQMLRDLIFHRLDITNPLDIPKYLTYTFMERNYPKFNKLLMRKGYNSYYEWAANSFPEYSDLWSERDFHEHVARDGVVCDSDIEKDVYEYLKYDLNIKYIEAIGTQYQGEHTFILPKDHHDSWYCPDFVIEYIERDGLEVKLPKTIYIEYFGMYMEKDYDSKVVTSYKEKTKRKNEFYSNLPEIMYIPLYPSDLKFNYAGIFNKMHGIGIVEDKIAI